MRSPIKVTEAHIEKYVCDFLSLDGWICRKMEQNFSERKVKLVGEKGMPDIVAIRYRFADESEAAKILKMAVTDDQLRAHVELLWVELKRPSQKPRPSQVTWKEAEERRGALCWIVDSIDTFPERYKASGLQRKAIS